MEGGLHETCWYVWKGRGFHANIREGREEAKEREGDGREEEGEGRKGRKEKEGSGGREELRREVEGGRGGGKR